jgi:starch-binding outer membrane protein, SusD/RagB family
MKRIFILLLLVPMSFSWQSCSEDHLNLQDPNRESADTYWEKEDDYRLGLTSCYSVFRVPGYFSRWFHVLMISRSDEGWSESPNPYFQAYSNFNIISYNDDNAEGLFQPWQVIYRQMFYCNQVIDNMVSRGLDLFDDRVEAEQILGQAYFLRGVAYWYLGGSYGKGPRMINSTDNGEIIEQEEIYLQALKDFEEAAKYLPERWPASDIGRATLGGAKGMLVRVYAQLAGYYNRPGIADAAKVQNYWGLARTAMEEIFLMDYTLVPDYKDNFTMVNENNSESLFEIQFNEGLYNGKELGAHRPKFFGLVVDGGAWADAYPRAWLLDEFKMELTAENEVDPRLGVTLFYEIPGDTTLLYGKTWAQWMLTEDYPLTQPCYWRKYTRVDTHSGEDYSSGINYRVLRLADLYLMYAEAINELNGNRSDAVEYINKVRRRAGMVDLDPANFSNYDALHDQIMHERLVELCGEGTRWYDLDRWGILHNQVEINSIANERDDEFSNFELGVSHLYPIPNRELSLYPGLEQNFGY